ncbi:MAG: hypothetical protein BWY56_00847 [Acidobacteria bacterium ADurb.Bin340]|nr:MAG: hypothetical protein BWY56_00847 [Acidobacteria bacterium ADurb.Bin340]
MPHLVSDGFGHLGEARVRFVHENDVEAFAGGVLQILARGGVDGFFADIGCLFHRPLETPGDGGEKSDGLLGNAGFLAPADHVSGEGLTHEAHSPFVGHGGTGQVGIAFNEGPNGVVQHGNGVVRQPHKAFHGDVQLHGTEGQHRPADALGVIAHPLQVINYLAGGVDEAEMAGRGLVAENEGQAQPVQFRFQVIHVLVAENDRVGDLAVPGKEGLEGTGEGPLVQIGHFQQLGPDHIAVALELGFEMGRVGGGQCRLRRIPMDSIHGTQGGALVHGQVGPGYGKRKTSAEPMLGHRCDARVTTGAPEARSSP